MENNMELIKVTTTENGSQVVSARELHEFLGSKQDFSTWIKARIDKYGFVSEVDFTLHKFMEGKVWKHEYILTIDVAKELAMVEGNEKGRQARRYFIECEKKLREVVTKPMTTAQMFALQAKAMLEMEELMNVMDEKINFIYDQYQNSQKQLSLLPLSEEPVPEQSLRSTINELVRSYATMVGGRL